MAHIQIQCQNCGAKYKIPEAFKGDSAKCKQCGSTIDVTAQRQTAADEPAAAQPAERGSPRRSETSAGSTRGDRGARRSSRRRRGEKEQAEPAAAKAAAAPGGRRRRGHRGEDTDGDGDDQGGSPRRARKKDPTPIVVGAIIGVLAIVAVTLVYTGWDQVTDKIKLPGQEEKYAAAQKRKAEAAEKERQERQAAAQAEHDRLAKEAADKASAAKKAKEAAAKKKKVTAKAEKLEDIFNPGTLAKVPWSDAVKADRQKELDELVATAMDSGLPGIRAQRKLEDTGWAALPALTNKLLTFDYKTTKGNNDAFVLSQIVERITGWDPQMATMTQGEKIEVKVAHENAIGVYQLHIKMSKYWKDEDGLKAWQKKNVK